MGRLFDEVRSPGNLYAAWHKTARGKQTKPSIIAFREDLDANIASIARDLRDETYRPGTYTSFLIKDPKERVISAAPVRDRVVQHALMNVYDGVFDRHLIHDTYACRVGKGTHAAVLRAFRFAKASRYFLKMDVRKYFASIDHAALAAMLARIVRDRYSLRLFRAFVDSASGKGIPVGNLASQYFANLYLSPLDHHFKERLGAGRYVRYMDDILVFSDDMDEIRDFYAAAVDYAADRLSLELKPRVSGGVVDGAPFLGFLVRRRDIRLQDKTKRRYAARVAEIGNGMESGVLCEDEAGRRMAAVTAHLTIARSRNFRNAILKRVRPRAPTA